ncbi:MAG TPA: Na+/H+ antiporter subunit E [Rubrobacteraceae bacterium]|nr:Na+/H+ antiporter subunit E [Rubrobacteraceae bacterium]
MRTRRGDAASPATLARRAVLRGALLALLWWALVGGDAGSWLVGAPAIVGATAASLLLSPGGWRWTPGGVLRFVPFFVYQSLVGGLDVALRALDPRLPLQPTLLDYKLRLPESPARVFMADTISLLPGTLSAVLEGRDLRVHTLTQGPEVLDNLRELERRVAALFGLELLPEDEGGTG